MRVYKFHAPLSSSVFDANMNVGAKVLSAQMQGEDPVMWALVDTSKPMETRHFRWYATGEAFNQDDAGGFVATVQMGQFVFHLFEVSL